jgi:T4-like virus tail tube protein gp19
MSGLANPRKNFRYILELDGANTFLIQEVQAPTLELPEIKHGAPSSDPDSKTPGKLIVGDLVVKKLMPAFTADTWAHNWMAEAMVGVAGGFMKTGFLKHLGPDGLSVVQKYFLGDVWVKKIEPGNLVSLGPGENIIETVTFAVKYYVATDSVQFNALLAAGVAAGIAGLAGND